MAAADWSGQEAILLVVAAVVAVAAAAAGEDTAAAEAAVEGEKEDSVAVRQGPIPLLTLAL